MTEVNPFDSDVLSKESGLYDVEPPSTVAKNPFDDDVVYSPTLSNEEVDIVSRINSPSKESPRQFGLVEFPATVANEFNRSFLSLPSTAGGLLVSAGELSQTMEGQTTEEVATNSVQRRLVDAIKADMNPDKGWLSVPAPLRFLGMVWGVEKDVLLSTISDGEVPRQLVSRGKEMMEQNKAATDWLFGAPKSGFAADLGRGLDSVAKSIGAWYITGNPAAAGGLMAATVYSQDYLEARQAGKDPEEAAMIAAASAYGQGKLEGAGMKVFTTALSGTFFKKVLFRAAEQSAEEASQAVVEETVKGVSGVRDTSFEDKLHSVLYQGALGFLVGAPVSGVFTIMEQAAVREGLSYEEVKKQAEALVKNKDAVIDGAAEIINRELSGITRNPADLQKAHEAAKSVLMRDEEVFKASEADPAAAAEIIMRTANDATRAAIQSLPDGFTMEQLQQAVQSTQMTLEATSAPTIAARQVVQTDVGVGMRLQADSKPLANPIEIVKDESYKTAIGQKAAELGVKEIPIWSGEKQTNKAFSDEFTAKAKKAGYGGAVIKSPDGQVIESISYDKPRLSPTAQARKEAYSKVLELAPAKETLREKAAKLGDDIKKMTGAALTPISTRLGNVNEKLKARLREYEFNTRDKINADQKLLEPFLRKMDALSPEDYAVLDFAMKNGDIQIINEIAEANNMTKELADVRKMLEGIRKRGEEIGLEIGYLDNYFPRWVTKPEKMLAHFRGTEEWGQISEALRQKENELGAPLDDEAKAELINTILRGYGKSQIALAKPANLKERKIDIITPEIAGFYAPTSQALLRYVAATNTNIETRRFLGRGNKNAGLYDNINSSIGWFVLHEMIDSNIKPSQEAELTDILQARFKQGRMGDFWRTYKNIEYLSTMGSPISAVTQLGDLAFSFYKNGVYRTLRTLPSVVAGKSKVTREDIGVEDIAQEFTDQTTMGKAVNTVFKLTGFNAMDRLGKETLINGALDRFQAQAKNPTDEFRQSLEVILGKNAEQAIADLKNGVISKDVKLLLFNELLDIQPVALSEMPAAYLKMGNGRVLYMLKTFTVKQFDIYRREVFSQLRTDPVQGMKNLTRLLAFFVLMNASADWLKDLLLGRETPVEDHVANNIFRVAGISKFQVYTARREGIGTAVGKSILPPFSVVDAAWKDMEKLSREGELAVENMRSVQSIPIGGKFYYWWMGAGSDK